MINDGKIISEGKQILDFLNMKYGETGIANLAKKVGISENSLLKYLGPNLDNSPKKTVKLILEAMPADFKLKTIYTQIDDSISHIENNPELYRGKIAVFERLRSHIARNGHEPEFLLRIELLEIVVTKRENMLNALEKVTLLLQRKEFANSLCLRNRILRELAHINFQLLQFDECNRLLQEIITNSQSDPQDISRAWHTYALSHLSCKRYKQSLDAIARSREYLINNTSRDLVLLNLKAVCEYEQGNAKKSKKTLEFALSRVDEKRDTVVVPALLNNAFEVWKDDKEKSNYYSSAAMESTKDNRYSKSAVIASINRIRYCLRHNEKEITQNTLSRVFKHANQMNLVDLQLILDRLASDLINIEDGCTYLESIRRSIMILANEEFALNKSFNLDSIYGYLARSFYTLKGEINDKKTSCNSIDTTNPHDACPSIS